MDEPTSARSEEDLAIELKKDYTITLRSHIQQRNPGLTEQVGFFSSQEKWLRANG